MNKYYYLTSLLPPLEIGEAPKMSFEEFSWFIKHNLSEKDYNQTVILRRLNDIENLRALWRGETFDQHGNFDKKAMEELLTTEERLPLYIFEFLSKYTSTEERLRFFPELIATFFKVEIDHAEGFLKYYLSFARDLRLVTVGFRAKLLERNIEEELRFEDSDDELVVHLIAQRDSKIYEPPQEFEGLKSIFEESFEKPLELHKKIYLYSFNRIEELCNDEMFSIDKVLSYLVQLEMVEKWMALDMYEGKKMVNEIIKALA